MKSQKTWITSWGISLIFHAVAIVFFAWIAWPLIAPFDNPPETMEVSYITIKGNPNSGGSGSSGASNPLVASLPQIAPMKELPAPPTVTSNSENSIITEHSDGGESGGSGSGEGIGSGGGDGNGQGTGTGDGIGTGSESGIQGDPNGTEVDGTFYPPVPRYTPKPKYPRGAKNKNVAGSVTVGLTIDADGNVSSAWVNGSSGSSELDDAAVSAVYRWRFKAARRGNTPVSTTTSVAVQFEIR